MAMDSITSGRDASGALKRADIMQGMIIIIGSNKKIILKCGRFAISNCCKYKEIPVAKCQRNVKESKKMSRAFERIIRLVSPEELELIITQ